MLWKRSGFVELLVEDTYSRVLHLERPFLVMRVVHLDMRFAVGKLLESW
jgi:hypothetical protein